MRWPWLASIALTGSLTAVAFAQQEQPPAAEQPAAAQPAPEQPATPAEPAAPADATPAAATTPPAEKPAPSKDASSFPKPSPYPISWELDFTHGEPKRVVVTTPGQPPKAYWYMTYSVTNNSDQER